jgi:hypothetical protein
MTRTEQNIICGKLHFNQKLLGRRSINPEDKHVILMSVGLGRIPNAKK